MKGVRSNVVGWDQGLVNSEMEMVDGTKKQACMVVLSTNYNK